MILLSVLATFALAQTPGPMELKGQVKNSAPSHQVMDLKENAEETLLETEVSRTERAEKMKKILKEVRQDLNQRKENRKKTQAPKLDDNTSTN